MYCWLIYFSHDVKNYNHSYTISPLGHIRDVVNAIPPPAAFADDICTGGIKRKEPGSGSEPQGQQSDEIWVTPITPKRKRPRESHGMCIEKCR